MKKKILLDTGPIVAFLNSNDQYHEWSIEQFKNLEPPFLTCESVVSESCFLLRKYPTGPKAMLELLCSGLIKIPFVLEQETLSIQKFLSRYSNVPISLADSCLVRMSEIFRNSILITLDDDFKIYRRNGREAIPILFPDFK